MDYLQILEYLKKLGDPDIAEHSQRFFKTGKGEYGFGDIFLGIRVPVIRQTVRKFKETTLEVIEQHLKSEFHEVRLFSLLLMVYQFSRDDDVKQKEIFNLYLSNTAYINNWDLVDSSAHQIVGAYLENRDKAILYDFVKSESLWERRIAIISTYHYIKKNDFKDTLKISEQLLNDKEDLIHKAVGWMLREVGKREMVAEVEFLKRHYTSMPRTMLRYAIEKFPESDRQKYLKGQI